ncbi:serine hydrolase [Sphingomonas sp. CJ20]
MVTRMKGVLFALMALLMLPTPATAQPSSAATLQALVDSYAANRGFNGTVLIARNGKVLVRSSYGIAHVATGRPNDPALRYRIGSLTKPFTATLVMQLVDQKRLRLDGTLGEYLPDLYRGTPAAPVTVAQLLSHTSGLADVPGRYDDPWWRTSARKAWTPTDFARQWIKPALVEQPGTKWRYNNNGFFLLGLIVERVTGQPYAEALRQRIFAPAGMRSSGVFARDTDPKAFAEGYSVPPGGRPTPPDAINPSVSFSAAGIYATADDLLRFDQALYGTALLSAQPRQTMLSAHSKFYGYGWGVDDYALPGGATLPVVSHTGSVPGYQSYYLRAERNRDCVIILDNFWQGALVSQMGRDLMEVLNGKPMAPARRSLDDALVPAAYTQGPAAMAAAYAALASRQDEYDLSAGAFNALGYRLLRDGRAAAAIQVFLWATERYPQSANGYDSLGEAYRAANDSLSAIRSYQKALALDPTMPSARAALAELQGPKP